MKGKRILTEKSQLNQVQKQQALEFEKKKQLVAQQLEQKQKALAQLQRRKSMNKEAAARHAIEVMVAAFMQASIEKNVPLTEEEARAFVRQCAERNDLRGM